MIGSTKRGALISSGIAVFCAAKAASAASLELTIAPIARSEGTLQIALYASEADFRKVERRALREPARAGGVALKLSDLGPGEYAVLVFQDLNGNGKLDTNVFGAPMEPWGSSAQSPTSGRAPTWADAKFSVPASGASISIKLQS